ncbi:adenosine deaminase [Granulicella tundricola]|uniref:Adenosine deaminase n=1 Tax=Granulicella tundricola (strain ATCC BAA-1859 / DSM 23138 / MP5ACTX9) TaxID=1198114 RepID=E8X3W6_GRATM|nr:adenosine deaminase [Granulicella tundricola]ADW70474.1 adenosine deaminase [Granulicella tundricola MP5ACTX9]
MARRPKQNPQDLIDIPTWLRGLPKAELHLHLEGTVTPETLVELSRRHDLEPLTLETARAIYVYSDFQAFLMAFKAVSERLQTPEDYEFITYEMIKALAAQGVVHAEVYISWGILLRFKPQLAIPSIMDAVERARLRAEAEFGTTLYWLIDAVRHFGLEEAATVFRLAAELRLIYPSIIGIGIGGDEARGPAEPFRDLYAEAKAAGLRLTVHAGESTGPVHGPASIWSAINIGAERIGHGLAAQHDADLLSILAERQIPIEINVTSNLRTGCCESLEAHPVREYFEGGLFLTLNSDDPPMFGSDLLGEYILVQEQFAFSLDEMREFAANSIEASFLPPERKLKLMADVERYAA